MSTGSMLGTGIYCIYKHNLNPNPDINPNLDINPNPDINPNLNFST